MATRIQVRRDSSFNWTENNPTLAEGEIGFETDTGLFKIGKGNLDWTNLSYAQVAGPTGDPGIPGTNGENGAPGDNGLSAYDIWINQGNSGTEQDFFNSLQGPGYEVTYDSSIHMLYDDVSYVWNGKTSWDVADIYTVPGDFSNSAYRIGDYVKFHFGDPSLPDSPYIEGWIYQLDPTYARIIIQRWSNNSNWSTTVASAAAIVPIFPAHFEPGYNFDMRINVALGDTTQPYTNISYPTFVSDIEYGSPRSFYGYHRGSYNPGDYVVISSKSNPGIKVFAYIGSIGYSNSNDVFYIYPLEILTWDASEIDEFNDWTLSIASPPKKEYKLSNPLPLPWDATDPQPPALPSPAQFARPEVTDVVSIFGEPGLFEVGNSVKAVSKSEPTAAFYGVITELGSASNSFVNSIEVTDISDWIDDPENTYNDWQLILGEKPVQYQLAIPPINYRTSDGAGEYVIQASDIGTVIQSGGGLQTFVISNALDVPAGSQVTIVQNGGDSGDVGVRGATFIETDGLTTGQVQLKGPFGAATLIKLNGGTYNGENWMVIGNFLSASTP